MSDDAQKAWHAVGSAAQAASSGTWLAVTVGNADVVIARAGNEWLAVADACTHAGCPFSEEADLEDGVIICNCHGSEFDLRTGEVLRGPAERPVRTYPVRVVGDQLEIEA